MTDREPTKNRFQEREIPIAITPELQFGLDLTRRITEQILPVYGMKQLDVPFNNVSKDFSYAVDEKAEDEIKKAFGELWEQGIYYGYATEDQGLVLPPDHKPAFIFLIDPVDGSRGATSGMEQACVNIEGVRGDNGEATFKDIEFGITHAIKEDLTYVGKKGEGVFIIRKDGLQERIERRKHILTELRHASMTTEDYNVRWRYLGEVLDPLRAELHCDYVFNSGSYGGLSLVRGQNGLQVDVRRKIIDEFPQAAMVTNPKCMYPMDIAAIVLMIEELGGKVTDADGKSLDSKRLWAFDKAGRWSPSNQLTLVAAVNPELHGKAMEKLREGFGALSKNNL